MIQLPSCIQWLFKRNNGISYLQDMDVSINLRSFCFARCSSWLILKGLADHSFNVLPQNTVCQASLSLVGISTSVAKCIEFDELTPLLSILALLTCLMCAQSYFLDLTCIIGNGLIHQFHISVCVWHGGATGWACDLQSNGGPPDKAWLHNAYGQVVHAVSPSSVVWYQHRVVMP